MSTETASNQELVRFEPNQEQIALIKRTVAQGATDDELALFLHQCQKTGLDPLARQIYWIKRGGKGTIQTSIDGFRVAAARTGKLAGSDEPVFTEEGGRDLKATVVVYRMVEGKRCPFSASARWSEYAPDDINASGSRMWKKMPRTMLGKCAEALALRKAFPADLSGIYTSDEMDQAVDTTPLVMQATPFKGPETVPSPTSIYTNPLIGAADTMPDKIQVNPPLPEPEHMHTLDPNRVVTEQEVMNEAVAALSQGMGMENPKTEVVQQPAPWETDHPANMPYTQRDPDPDFGAPPVETPDAGRPLPANAISGKQQKRMFAIFKKSNWPDAQLHEMMNQYDIPPHGDLFKRMSFVTWGQVYDHICHTMESNPK